MTTMSNRYQSYITTVPVNGLNVRDAVDRIFNDNFFNSPFRSVWGNGFNGGGSGGSRSGIALDVYETAREVVIIAAVPGLGPDDINVSVHENTVTLSGQLPNVAQSAEAKQATWYIHELPYGSFQRSLKLPVDIDPDGADATFENGILHLHLPKATQARPRQITVRRSEPRATAEPLALPEDEAPTEPVTNGTGDHADIGEAVTRG
jgi:HSP20 family protein